MIRFVVTCLAALLLPGAAAIAQPLYAKNDAPVAGLVGFPAMRDAAVLERGDFHAGLHTSLASSYTERTEGDESIIFDGETASIAALFGYGLGDGWEVEAGISWRRHSGGTLDRWIEDWHDLWGLPDGGRPNAPRDRFDFSYRGPHAQFTLREAASGTGDAHVAAVRNLWRSDTTAVSARAGVKIGIGDESLLLGGGQDYYVSLDVTHTRAEGLGLVWHGQLGYLRAGKLEILGSMQKRHPWFAGVGVEWPVWPSVILKTQVDVHAPVADSGLRELGDTSVLLTVGMTFSIAPELEAEIGFTEDIAPDTAPDFVPRAGIRYVPGKH